MELHGKLVPLNGLPDRTAHAVQDALLMEGVELPQELIVMSFDTSIYDFWKLSSENAFKAFEAGFRDVDSAPEDGLSPLMYQCFYENDLMADWLLSKGADLERRVSQFRGMKSPTAMHLFARLVSGTPSRKFHKGIWLPVFQGDCEDVPSFPNAARRALLSGACDGCQCACSANGCLPRTNIFNTIAADNRVLEGPHLRILREWMAITLDAADELRTEVVEDLIRALTFDKLRMRHTCCHPFFYPSVNNDPFALSSEEVEEIQDEEWALVQELEAVVCGVSAAYTDFKGSILEFVEQYWELRMAQSLENLKNDDDVDATARAGVVLKPEDSD
ncbi:MAG: hypothetical protein Q9157_009090 [Trypethelium eluteriae]